MPPPSTAAAGVRAAARRLLLGGLLTLGAAVLLVRPGMLGKGMALILLVGAVVVFSRRYRSESTVIIGALLAIALLYSVLTLLGHTDWIVNR